MKEKKTFLDGLDRGIGLICKAGSYVTPVLILFIMLLIVFDVCRRTLFGNPVNGSVELIQNLIAVAGFMAMGWTTYLDKHIRIDSLTSKLPKTPQRIVDFVTSVVPLIVIIPLCRQGFVRTQQAAQYNEVTSILQITVVPFLFLMAIGFVLLLLGQIMVVLRVIFGREAPGK